MGRFFIKAVLCLGLLFLGACVGGSGSDGRDPGSSASQGSAVISAADGGMVTSPDGKLILEIPPGALDEDTEISIELIESKSGAPGYEFKPDGLVFNQPAMVHMEMDLAEEGPFEDENGEPLDPTTITPFLGLFLKSADGTFEALDNIHVESEEGSSIVTISAPIPHFTSLIGAVGRSYYAYLVSLGTHYVGSDFKRDFAARYLGYSTTHSYQNMSLSYKVLNITVTKIKYEVSGAIKIVSPAEITRNAFLSKRGQESSNRPKFNCDKVGTGTVKATVSATGVVEVTFQPENKTLVYTVNTSESTTRKGKCIARVAGFYQNGISGYDNEGLLVALRDPLQDLAFFDGEPATGLELPGHSDFSDVVLGIRGGDTLEASFLLNGPVAPTSPEYLQYLNYNLGLIDEGMGYEGSGPFAGVFSMLSLEAVGPGAPIEASFLQWDSELAQWETTETEVDVDYGETGISLLIPLSELGLSEEDLEGNSFRFISLINMAEGYPYAGDLFMDTVDLSI